jgi:hypothetical protein
VLTVIMTKKGGFYAVLTAIVTIMTITGRFICSFNSYCDKKGRSLCGVNSYCDNNDNNREVNLQC